MEEKTTAAEAAGLPSYAEMIAAIARKKRYDEQLAAHRKVQKKRKQERQARKLARRLAR